MAIGITLNATCYNQTNTTLAFQPDPAVHGNPPTAQPNGVGPMGESTVIATPIDPTFGPSPEGSFPHGYAVPKCYIGRDDRSPLLEGGVIQSGWRGRKKLRQYS